MLYIHVHESITLVQAHCYLARVKTIYCICRPSDTHKGETAAQQANLNLLYWSNEGWLHVHVRIYMCVCDCVYLYIIETTVSADTVCGKCSIVREEDIEGDIIKYSSENVNRFYFMEVSMLITAHVCYNRYMYVRTLYLGL